MAMARIRRKSIVFYLNFFEIIGEPVERGKKYKRKGNKNNGHHDFLILENVNSDENGDGDRDIHIDDLFVVLFSRHSVLCPAADFSDFIFHC